MKGAGSDMRTATGLTLIALGAILAFAVNGHPSWLNLQVVGWVIMLTGVTGMLIPSSSYTAVRRRIVRKRTGPSGPVTEVYEHRYPPYIRLNTASMEQDPGELVADQHDEPAERSGTVEEYLDT
jgi:hypothetical protein